MAPRLFLFPIMIVMTGLGSSISFAQTNTDSSLRTYKNVLRYNLSGAFLFGFDKYVVLGYERVLSPKKSISVNFGTAALPKVLSLVTDSFQTNKEGNRKGYNLSIDYRFYLAKENKFEAPRGVYIGPYYSYNHYENEKEWMFKKNGVSSQIMTKGDFNIHTFGFELGYQLLLWKRFSLDLVLVGPGVGFYKYKASYNATTNLSSGEKEQLFDAMQQLLEQKFPGMNYVFSDDKIDADGVLKTRDIGYRYIIHIGYAF